MLDVHWHEDGLTVGGVAERMHITRSAVRWYDDHGLLPSRRTSGNQRRFFPDVCCRIAMIRVARRVGLSTAEIRGALDALPPRQAPTRQDWERLATRLREDVGQRIDELSALLAELAPEQVGPEDAGSRARPAGTAPWP